MEMQLLPSLKNTNTVIATGGGLPIYNDNFKKLNFIGTTIYLKTSAEELNRRTKIESSRPLIKNKDSIGKILDFRNSAYQKAHFTILTDFKSPQEIVATIISIIQ
jgi:shikimate kinase